MFGLSKKEKFAKEVTRMLHEDYHFGRQDAGDLVSGHLHVVFSGICSPAERAIALASLAYRILAESGRTDQAERVLTRLWFMASQLQDSGVISKLTRDVLLKDLPSPVTLDSGHVGGERPPVSRVECARAGWIFTFYWQIYLPQKAHLPKASVAEIASLEGTLKTVFTNPRFNTARVCAIYQRGEGSNDVLKLAMAGLPDYAFRWFRIGQVVNSLLDSIMNASDADYALAELAVRGNLSSGGVSQIGGDALLDVAWQLRSCYASGPMSGKAVELVTLLQETMIKFAARQDNFMEFEKVANQHGGVFISYAHSDAVMVHALAKRLEAEQVSFWLDDNEVKAGDKVRTVLSGGIESNCVFLVVLSPASVSSNWVAYELEQALIGAAAGSHVVVPVLAHGMTPDAIPPSIKDVVCADLSGGIEPNIGKLLKTIRSHLVVFEERRRGLAAVPP